MIAKKILQSVLVACVIFSSMITLASEPTKTVVDENNIYTEDKLNIIATPQSPEFIIKLKSNPTTGYSWFLREYDANLITPIKHSFIKPTQDLMGAPGFESWTFKVKPIAFAVPQQTVMRFIYARPWQGSESSTQIVFHVTTQGK